MPHRIEDYALIGDTQTAGLVSIDGSIDWLCLPRFDSAAIFASLLGQVDNGRWQIHPDCAVHRRSRRYRGDSLVLETEFETDRGTVRVVDAMPIRRGDPDVVRIVEGVSGEVPMHLELVIRFDYGSIVPWVRRRDGVLAAIAGPDAVYLFTKVPTRGVGLTTQAEFVVREGEQVPFHLLWHPSHEPPPAPHDPIEAVRGTESWWREWSDTCSFEGPDRDAVVRSLVTLKALTFAPTGGIVAAPTTSVPEAIGGVRNWDYRFCWLRDATFTLYALLSAGYLDEALAWRDWLLRAVAGEPSKLQIMYGVAGERRLPELELPWLAGYEGSRPVRVGNAAAEQLQLDVYGEVMDAMHAARRHGLDPDPDAWRLQQALLEFLETGWQHPDEGLWEVRGPRRHFTHSKVMSWVAFDRAVKAAERFGLDGPVECWRGMRDLLHEEIVRRAWNPDAQAFTQSYGSRTLDAAVLQMALVGFLPIDDPRIRSTIAAVERELMVDGLVLRYPHEGCTAVDGLPPGEGAFLACTFWLADNYVLQGRMDEARRTYERVLAVRNDVGLLAEEYDPHGGRMVGNFPQAFSHVGLVNTALNISRRAGPAEERGQE